MSNLLMREAPDGYIGVAHPSGWVQSHLFTMWFEHFVAQTKPTEKEPILLIVYSHYIYTRNIELIDLARPNFVKITSLHLTSHKSP